jgi:hypothetical protein
MWTIEVGALTDLPQSRTWHLENGLVFGEPCAFLAFDKDRLSVHSPQ